MTETGMAYDLRYESWIPWRRRSGRVQWGPISMLTDDLSGDPVVALAAPRPDFGGALTEFLIGMLTVALQPRDEKDWKERWDQPPTPDALEQALTALPDAFFLVGGGPRFLQDFSETDLADGDVLPIERLLFDAPGEQAVKLNKDLFVKRASIAAIGPAAAAMALITMQTYAPSGGQGHRTSMRGGGPLTTLVDPRLTSSGSSAESLWRYLWANVETRQLWTERAPTIPEHDPASLFPWMGPTRESSQDGAGPTTPADGHPLQVYFGMPRRLRLIFAGAGRCDLTGLNAEVRVVGFQIRNYGVEYDSWPHPLSPYYQSKRQSEWLPMHPQPDRIGWKDWHSLTVESAERGNRPAQAVGQFKSFRARIAGCRATRVRVFGVDFDNMKCRGWVDATIPMFIAETEARQVLLQEIGGRLTRATEIAAVALRFAVKCAIFAVPEDASSDFTPVSTELWAATESAFYSALSDLAARAADGEATQQEAIAFQRVLATSALIVFDRWCPVDSAAPVSLRRTVAARYGLTGALSGHGKMGSKLFGELQVAPPNGGGKQPKASRKKVRVTA